MYYYNTATFGMRFASKGDKGDTYGKYLQRRSDRDRRVFEKRNPVHHEPKLKREVFTRIAHPCDNLGRII